MDSDERSAPGAASAMFWSPAEGSLPRGARFVVATRLGGASEGPFATLNLGLRAGDREDAVLENVRRVRQALGMDADEPLRVRQVHGTALVSAEAAGAAPGPSVEADGILLRAGDPWAAVSVADCAPVALVSEDGGRGALVHSGWRSTLRGIALRAADALARSGSSREAIHVVIGPCIHACCYPVGPETARLFPTSLLRFHPGGGFALDLPAAIAASLTAAGVPARRIAIAPECTACLPERFYSHRRDHGTTGRHWAMLRLQPPAG